MVKSWRWSLIPDFIVFFVLKKLNQFSQMHLSSHDGEHEINTYMLNMWIFFAAAVADWRQF